MYAQAAHGLQSPRSQPASVRQQGARGSCYPHERTINDGLQAASCSAAAGWSESCVSEVFLSDSLN